MSIVRQVIGWGEGCYWNLRLKAGFEMLCCVQVGVFVHCKCDSGGFAGPFCAQNHGSTAYPELEGICMDQLLALYRRTPKPTQTLLELWQSWDSDHSLGRLFQCLTTSGRRTFT